MSRGKPISRGKGLKQSGGLKTKKRIRQVSKKQERIWMIRKHLRIFMMLSRGPSCEIKSPGCQGKWSEMHERFARGPGGSPIDKNNIICTCHNCHEWVGNNILEAESLGFYRRASHADNKQPYQEQPMSSFETLNGHLFDFDNPDASTIYIQDIALSLSNQCRYAGHVPQFYSVAQHSVIVAEALPDELKLQGLLHDAHEAYIGDCTAPLKLLLPDYQKVEDDVAAVVRLKFGLPRECDSLVKEMDIRALVTEQLQLRGIVHDDQWPHLPLDIKIKPWNPKTAAGIFLEQFKLWSNQ